MSVAFGIEIVSNVDNSIVFQLTKTVSYATSYDLPSGSILNGQEYKVRITIWNSSDQSISSDYEIFQTSSRPVVTLNSIGTVGYPSYNFTATYTQAESVAIRSHIFYLYNSSQTLIAQSGILTSTNLEYLFSNLKSESDYYIEVQVISSKGLTGTTGKVSFSVLYTQPQYNVGLTASNVENAGIKLSWKVIQIIGQSNCADLTYIDNEKIDLTNGCVVTFDDGFSLSKNFTIKVWLEKPAHKKELLYLKGDNGNLKLQYHYDDERFHLLKEIDSSIVTFWSSEPISSDKYFVGIQQIDQDINIYAEAII